MIAYGNYARIIISNDEEDFYLAEGDGYPGRNKMRMIARVRELMSPRNIQMPRGGSAEGATPPPPITPDNPPHGVTSRRARCPILISRSFDLRVRRFVAESPDRSRTIDRLTERTTTNPAFIPESAIN